MAIDRAPDEARVEAFAGRLLSAYTDSMVTLMIDLGLRTGLFEALAAGDQTSAELAARAGLVERYVREWLGALVTAGIISYDPATARYVLPAEHAVWLTGPGTLNLAPISQVTTLLARQVDGVTRAFREGGGVPSEAFRPEFTRVMDGLSGDYWTSN
jgi:Rv2258c-like winged HTH domain